MCYQPQGCAFLYELAEPGLQAESSESTVGKYYRFTRYYAPDKQYTCCTFGEDMCVFNDIIKFVFASWSYKMPGHKHYCQAQTTKSTHVAVKLTILLYSAYYTEISQDCLPSLGNS